jgi:outer membrane protein assembly factor BamE (lipoprotein component of BamABCDE complex)
MENYMKNKIVLILILFLTSLSFSLESCAVSEQVTGRPIDTTLVQNIAEGKTKSEDIITWFGAPSSTSQLGDNTLYIYKYCVSKGSGVYTGYFGKTTTEEKCDELTVTFDKEGMVKAHNFVKRVE